MHFRDPIEIRRRRGWQEETDTGDRTRRNGCEARNFNSGACFHGIIAMNPEWRMGTAATACSAVFPVLMAEFAPGGVVVIGSGWTHQWTPQMQSVAPMIGTDNVRRSCSGSAEIGHLLVHNDYQSQVRAAALVRRMMSRVYVYCQNTSSRGFRRGSCLNHCRGISSIPAGCFSHERKNGGRRNASAWWCAIGG